MPTGGIDIGALGAALFGGADAAAASGAAAAGTAAGLGAGDVAALTLPEVAVTAAAPEAAGAGILGDLGGAAAGLGAGAAGLAPAFAAGGASASPLATQLASAAPTAVSDSLPASPTSGGGASGIGGVPSASSAGGPSSVADINTAAVGSPSLPGGVSNSLDTSVNPFDWIGKAGNISMQEAGITPGAANPFATSPVGLSDTLSKIGGGALDFAKSNPGTVLGGAGILGSLLMNNSIPGLDAVKNQEQLLAGLGAQNISAANTGQIPGGQQAQLDAAERAAEAATRSSFGREGIGGSTMENQSLVADKIAEAQAKNQIIQQIVNTGVAELGQAGSLATGIMNTELTQNKDVQDAIGRFAAALAGSSGLKAAAA